MNINRRSIILIGSVVLVIVLIVLVGLNAPTGLPQDKQEQPTATFSNPSSPETAGEGSDAHTDAIVTTLGNLHVLESVFEEKAYLYIDSSTMEYATQTFDQTTGFTIDEVSFSKRDASSYQFMVRDQNDNRLFYVIATMLPDNEISVEFYNI